MDNRKKWSGDRWSIVLASADLVGDKKIANQNQHKITTLARDIRKLT